MDTTATVDDRPTDTDAEAPQTDQELEKGEDLKKFKRKVFWKRFAFRSGDLTLLAVQTAVVITAIFAAVPLILSIFLGYSFSTVLTGSMAGSIDPRDVVVTKQYNGQGLSVGDIVGVKNGSGHYIHRIVAVNEDGTFTTKGDANDTPDLFKPHGGSGSGDLWGVLDTVHKQPVASYLTLFSYDPKWGDDSWGAITGGDFEKFAAWFTSAPWGFLALVLSVVVFWWLIPDLIAHLRSRAEARDELAMELLKRQVASHEGSLTELEPVVDELKQDHDAAKAKEEEEARAFREALEAPLSYDPENLFDEPEPSSEVDDADAFLRALQARHGTTGLTTRSSQNELPALVASTPDSEDSEHRSESSAFDMDEIDDIRELIK